MKKIKIILFVLCMASVIFAVVYRNMNHQLADVQEPVMTVEEPVIHMSIEASEEMLIQGIHAEDDRDGDVSDNIMIETIQKKADGAENEFEITYVCFDKSSNMARTSRTLFYDDYQSPHFELSGDLRFALNSSASLTEAIAANDVLDGVLTPFISIEGATDLSEVTSTGIYPYTLSVTNSVGDKAVLPVKVEMYENTYEEQSFRPKIVLKRYLVYIKQGESFNPEDYLDYVYDGKRYSIDFGPMVTVKDSDKKVTQKVAENAPGNWINVSRITTMSDIDTSQKGIYIVGYKYTSSGTQYEGSTKLIVVVE